MDLVEHQVMPRMRYAWNPAQLVFWAPALILLGVGFVALRRVHQPHVGTVAARSLPAFHVVGAADLRGGEVMPPTVTSPMAVIQGCILRVSVQKGQPLTDDDLVRLDARAVPAPRVVGFDAKQVLWLGEVPSPGTLVRVAYLPPVPAGSAPPTGYTARPLGVGELVAWHPGEETGLALALPDKSWAMTYQLSRTARLVLSTEGSPRE